MKRLFMILCLTVLLAVVLAVPAFAAEGHTHCLCVDGSLTDGCTGHNQLAFQEISDAAGLEAAISEGTSPVNIHLTNSFTLESAITTITNGKTVNLCLGDQTLTVAQGAYLYVSSNSTLNITACDDGKIVSGTGNTLVLQASKGAINLYGGTLDFTAVNGTGSSYTPIKLDDGTSATSPYVSTFTMYDGHIIGATMAYRGGAIYVSTGNVYMHGGSITGGTAALGGAISVNKGVMVMDGGEITGCAATTTGGGVNIQANATSFTLSGAAKIYGNTVGGLAQDVYMGKTGLSLVLDGWSGNGEHGALAMFSKNPTQNATVVTAASGELTEADLANVQYPGRAMSLSDGKAVLGAHTHCLCVDGKLAAGCSDGHTNLTFTEVGTYEELAEAVAAEGTEPINITLTASFEITDVNLAISGKTVNLCLSGETITLNKKIVVNDGGTLNITACNGGKIIAKTGNTGGQLLIAGSSSTAGNIKMYAGTVDASNVEGTGNAGAVYINAGNSSFTLYRGTIVGAGQVKRGGGVFVNNASATFYMYGGEITGGHATEYGGAINVASGSVEMSDGIITGCTADTNGGGVSLLVGATSFTLSGDAKIYGNTADDVYIGNSNNTDTYFLTLGQWEGNGKDENGNARTLKLVHKAEAAGTKVIGYADGVMNPAAMRSYFAVSDGYQLMADAEKMTLQASTAHIHCICNGTAVGVGDHICQDVVFTEVSTADAFNALFVLSSNVHRLQSGVANVCLTGDFTLTTQYKIQQSAVFNLCLNGQTLTLDGVNLVAEASGVINVGDCGTTGKVSANDAETKQMLAAGNKGGQVNLFNGTVDASDCDASSSYGGAVLINYTAEPVSSFNMYGGKIIGAKAMQYGGAVCVNAGTFDMYGGTITTTGSCQYGGNVYVNNNAIFTMHDGLIENGTATTTSTTVGAGGGNVYVLNGGTFDMRGGTVSGGKCESAFGGNVCVLGTMTMTGGTITGGTAKNGGNVAVSSDNTTGAIVGGDMTMSGGLITMGTATGRGNGVYIRNNSNDLTLSGNAKIYGNNTNTGDMSDVSVAKALTDGAYRAIQLNGWNGNGTDKYGQPNPKLVVDREGDFAQRFAVFAESAEVDGRAATYFASKTSGYYVLLNDDDQLVFVNTPGNVTLRSGSDVVASFSKLKDAVIAAQGSNDIVLLNQPVTEDVTVSDDVYVDLNGFDVTGKVTVRQGSLYLIDRATADYAVDTDEEGNVTGGYGKITGGVEGDYAATFNTPKSTYGNNWKYLVLEDANGLHAHRIYLAVSDAVLYPQTTSLKYKTVFYGDEVVAGAIGDYGIILSETNEVSAGFGVPVAYAGGNDNSKLTLLSKVLETDMELAEQIERSDKQITARAYIKLNGAQANVLESSPKTVSFESVVTEVLHWTEEEGKHLTAAQKMTMVDMHARYETLIHSWCGEDSATKQIHSDWMANTKCVCMEQYEGHEAHTTCQYNYYEAVASEAEFAAYFTDGDLNQNANLRLTGSFTLTSKYNTNGYTLNIWLNGQTLTITGDGNLGVTNSGTLSITEVADGTGRIDADCTRPITVALGTLNLFDGYLDASGVTGTSTGGAILLNKDAGTFNMFGGTISGTEDTTSLNAGNGGLVCVNAGNTFNMYGGTISGGNSTGNGGNVYVAGTMNLRGGTIENGKANGSEKGGGNIYITGDGSKLVMTGGTIRNGSASADNTLGGSNVCAGYIATFEMTDGVITNDATSDYAYGGVCVRSNAKAFKLSGEAKIYGHGMDVYLQGSKHITLGAWNGNGEDNTLKVALVDGEYRVATFADDVTTDDAKNALLSCFALYDPSESTLGLTSNMDGIEVKSNHYHCICGAEHVDVADHTAEDSLNFARVTTKAQWDALFTDLTLKADTTIFLGADLELTDVYRTGAYTLTLCLNGKTLTMNGGQLVADSEGKLRITDCGEGKILANDVDDIRVLSISNGSIDLYGGTIDASKVNNTGNGGAVYVNSTTATEPTSVFTMYGGQIIGATSAGRGGAVYVNSGSFIMHGGSITGGQATYGGAVGVNYGDVQMTGGSITGATATTNGGGVCILSNSSGLTLSGDAKIYGNTANSVNNDVHIGNNNGSNYYLQLGQWNGNGQDNGVNRVLNLSRRDAEAGKIVVRFTDESIDRYAMRDLFEVTGFDLEVTESSLRLQAEGAHMHCLCNGALAGTEGHTCVDTVFLPATNASFVSDTDSENVNGSLLFESWNNTTQIRLKADTNIYLAEDVTLNANYRTSGKTLNICLYGHTLSMSGTSARLTAGRYSGTNTTPGTLNITACEDAGKIAAGTDCKSGFLYTGVGNINMYGGTVTASEQSISAVTVNGNANGVDTFTLYGGTLVAGKAKGGAVSVAGGKLVMNGGTIDATSTSITGNGAAVYVENNDIYMGELTMNNGTIMGGTAGRGGAVYTISGKITMNGGTISGGKATTYGGNVGVASTGEFIMNGGNVISGESVNGGGNLFVTGSTATISGGSITGGKVTATGVDLDTEFGGGNICVGDKSILNISGGTINGGTCGVGYKDISVQPTSDTITLSGAPTVGELVLIGKSLTMSGPLTGGSVGIKLKSDVGEFAVFTEGTASADHFTSIDDYTITVDDDRLLLTVAGMVYSAAYAEADIRPTAEDVAAGLQLSGYGVASHKTSSASTVEELLATALAVTDANGDTVLMISVDACDVSLTVANKARRSISRRTGVPVDNIAISAVHQHSTPEIVDTETTSYATTFHNGVVEAGVAAINNRAAVNSIETGVVATQGQGESGESFNYVRNIVLKDGDGNFVGTYTDNHYDVEKTSETWSTLTKSYESNVDHTMQLIKITLASGKPVILANFQTHPHLSGRPDSYNVHADVVGAFRDQLGTLTGADVIYISGASGNVNPRDAHLTGESYEKDQHVAYGNKLAEVANTVVYTAVDTASESWDVAMQKSTENLYIRNDLVGLDEAAAEKLIATARQIREGAISHDQTLHVNMISDLKLRIYSVQHARALMSRYEMLNPTDGTEPITYQEVEISAFSLGPVGIVNAPYEMFQENGQTIKEISVDGDGNVTDLTKTNGFEMVIVATKCNGSNSYIPSLAGYTNGGYSTDIARYESGTGEALAERYQAMLTALNPAQ